MDNAVFSLSVTWQCKQGIFKIWLLPLNVVQQLVNTVAYSSVDEFLVNSTMLRHPVNSVATGNMATFDCGMLWNWDKAPADVKTL